MSSARFEELLERTMGLKAASIGSSAITRALDKRMGECATESHDAYWDLLQRSREELHELIEAVVVPETWFFRDPQAFAAMVRFVGGQWLKGDPTHQLRLLSLPCSTGEEPYTMAMALLDADLPAGRFRIDAVDISTQSLARARHGIYGRNSFRSRDLAFRERHFEPADGFHRISDAVRAPVHFRQGNILEADFLACAEGYDVIFCRNLLIYFDAPTQVRAIAVLKRLLAPSGMLFVGHSEAGLMPASGFVSARIPMAFAFHREAEQKCSAEPAAVTRVPAKGKGSSVGPVPRKFARATAPDRQRPMLAAAPRPEPPQPKQAQSEQPESLAELRRIADCGRLDEAARGCEAYMRDRGPSPDALLLLGLINDASGDTSAAITYYRKVLYLEPGNAEALGHLALLLRKLGDHAGARLIDERMRRQDQRGAR